MFTGIVTDLGHVRAVTGNGDTRLEIATGFDPATLAIGGSVCCSGVCLTVVDMGADGANTWFAATASSETLARTTLAAWQTGTPVNLERALKLGEEIGGHMVSGHVDGVATVVEASADGASTRLVFDAPGGLEKMVTAKGSVAVDGVSLTVNDTDGRLFGVNVIPHTLSVTTLGGLAPGDGVNLEIDLLARYVARLLESD